MNLSKYRLNRYSELNKWLYEDEARTMRFYRKVYEMLDNIPEGGTVFIPSICQESSFELFIKIVCLYISEMRRYTTPEDSYLELSTDYTTITRMPASRPQKSLYRNVFRR